MPELTALSTLTTTPHAEVFDANEPRTVRLDLEAGERVPEHTHPDCNVVIVGLDGTVAVTVDDETYEVGPDDVLRFDGRRTVSPAGETDARALVVLAPKGEE